MAKSRSVRAGLVTIATLACAVVLLASPNHLGPSAKKAPRPPRAFTVVSKTPAKMAPRTQYPSQSYGMYLSYYSVRGDLQTWLTLNNKGGHVLTPHVTLYASDGRRYAFPNIAIASGEFAELNMRDLAAIAGVGFEVGSIRVSYEGLPAELGGMLRMTNVASGIEFSEALMYPNANVSNRLEGVWWVPNEATTARLAVTNTTGSAVDVQVRFARDTPRHVSRTKNLHLDPWQLQVLDFSPSGEDRIGRAGGISITYTGAAGGVKARGMIANYSIGYSGIVEFSDPANNQASVFHGAGVRVTPVDVTPLEPVIVARNVSNQPARVVGRLQVTTGEGEVSTVDLPSVVIAPAETVVLDARQAWRRAAARTIAPTVGIEFEHTGAPGSVIVSVASVSANFQHVFRVLLRDPTTLTAAAGEYFWHLEGARTTVVYLKNMTDVPQRYHLYLRYEGGPWSFGLKTLAPHQSVALDIGEIKASQIPDARGRTMPTSVVKGQVHWSLVGGQDSKAIDGRAEQVDISGGVSSTYACGVYGVDWFGSVRADPDETPLIDVDEDVQIRVYETDYDFNDHHETAEFDISAQLEWSELNSGIVSSSGYGWYTGVDEGTADEYAFGTAAGMDETRNPVPVDLMFDIQVRPKCWLVQNFHKTSGVKATELKLEFEYRWESTSGNVHDLAAQSGLIWETVTYNKAFASPPWNSVMPGNPFERSIAPDDTPDGGTSVAGMGDTHTTGLPVAPYSADTVIGAQEYWYGSNCKTKQSLATFTIRREIYSFTQSGATKWGVKTQKDGVNGDYKPLSDPEELPFLAFGPLRPAVRPLSRTILTR